ncbi:unnamed protein product [Brassica oleracea]
MTGQDASYGPLSSLNGFDLPAQSLAQLQGAGLARPVMPFPRGLLSSQSSTSQTMLPNRERVLLPTSYTNHSHQAPWRSTTSNKNSL